MNALALVLALAAAPQSTDTEPLLELARRLDADSLVAAVRARPAEAREAVAAAFAAAVSRPAEQYLLVGLARAIAAAHHDAWSDPFLLAEVGRFGSWTVEQRRARVRGDSLRREGNAAYGRDGPAAAIARWRQALELAGSIPDTASMAGLLGNIGAGLQRSSRPDSAEAYLLRSRLLAATIGDRRVEANALALLAWSRHERGEYADARRLYASALVLRRRTGDIRGEAGDRHNLGLVTEQLGDAAGARAHFEAALRLNREQQRGDAVATNLTGLAALASAEGDIGAARSLYEQSLEVYRAAGLDVDAADVLHSLGLLEVRAGNYPTARRALTEALHLYDRVGLPEDAVAVGRDRAAAAAAMGELQAALEELRAAEHTAEVIDAAPAVRAGVALAGADLALLLNRMAEAEALYARAGMLYRRAGDFRGAAAAREGVGMLLLEREDFGRAERELEAVRRSYEDAGDRRSAALTRMWIAAAQLGRADTVGARKLLRRGIVELREAGDPVAEAALVGELARLEAGAGLPAMADSLFEAGLELIRGRAAPDVHWYLLAARGMAARSAGTLDSGAAWLRQAVAEIERTSAGLALPERRSAYRADKWEVYAQLALTEWMGGRTAAAFEASERLRARETADLIERARGAPPPGIPPDLAGRERALRRRIVELGRAMEGPRTRPVLFRGADADAAGAVGREALARAQSEYANLLLEIHERAGAPGRVDPAASGWRSVAQRLPQGAMLVEYLVSDSAVLAFVVTADTLASFEVAADRRELARLVEFAREELGRRSSLHGSSWRVPLRRLHHVLIRPLEQSGLLRGRTQLVLVPHGELHYLPFAALLDDEGRYLVERFELAYAPSASLWVSLGDRLRSATASGLLAVAPRPDLLPASFGEVTIAARLAGPGGAVITGRAASEEVFRRVAPDHRILHVATLGVLNKHNPLFSFVELAPGDGHDGRLEVHEVLDLRLGAELVVLSACQTGLGSGALADVPTGDDWVGFTRAFLQAGAAAVIATLWSVEDASTAELMEAFYREWSRGPDPTRALAAAQRTLLRRSRTAHPFDWAGVTLVTGAPTAGAAAAERP